jgi:hypothetical protein
MQELSLANDETVKVTSVLQAGARFENVVHSLHFLWTYCRLLP